jgi:hypothetical protein
MYLKRVAGAAIAAGVGMSALTVGGVLANAAPLKPPSFCENCGPSLGGPGPGGPAQGPGPGGPGGPQFRPRPYAPKGAFDRGNARVGGPTDAPHGFSTLGHGAPPPPPQGGFGWNDGPAPGGPPPNWQGPPPPGGWNGPPPPGGWNSPWNGPPRYIAQAQGDFGPFDYGGYSAIPVFNPVFGGWASGTSVSGFRCTDAT